MKQQGSITVHGGVSGNNNQFNNHFNIKNVTKGGNSSKNDSDLGGFAGVMFGVFAVIAVSTFVYLRHFHFIFMCLDSGMMICAATLALTSYQQWRGADALPWATLFVTILLVAQGCVAYFAEEAMPAEVLALAQQPTIAHGIIGQAFEVWGRFNDYGHRLITENLLTVLCLAPAIILNLVFTACYAMHLGGLESEQFSGLFRKLWNISKRYLAPTSAFLTAMAGLIFSGAFPFGH